MTYFDPGFVLKTTTLPESIRTQLRAAVHLLSAHITYDMGSAAATHLAGARDILLLTAARESGANSASYTTDTKKYLTTAVRKPSCKAN